MKLLCLDTSTAAVTVALVEDGVEVAAFDREVGIGHGELLATAVSSVLGGSRPDAVAVGLGPGPFTSLRVGLATAAALADAWSVSAYGACSLDLLAAPDTVVVQDARRKEVYTAEYDGAGARVLGPRVITPAALAQELVGEPAGRPVRVVGAGAFAYASMFTPAPDAPRLPRAGALWGLVADRLGGPADALTPLYLRRPDAVASTKPRPSVLQSEGARASIAGSAASEERSAARAGQQ